MRKNIRKRNVKYKTRNGKFIQEYWIFKEYVSKEDYPNNPFQTKIFFNHEVMKMYSADNSPQRKKQFPGYISDYEKVLQ